MHKHLYENLQQFNTYKFLFGASRIMYKYFGVLVLIVSISTIYSSNITEDAGDGPIDPGIFGTQLIEWTLGHKTTRDSRVMHIPLTAEDAIVVSPDKDYKPMPKLVNINSSNNNNNIPGSTASMRPQKPPGVRQVSETDLYLLGAIEKLVYRADFMEKRLRKVEEMMHYVIAGSRVDREPCPINFMRAGANCYYFSDLAGREKDWKQAMQQCKKFGGSLAEMETIEENQDVVAHIQSNSNLKGKDFWTGGLNPGLLWIWSGSARPVSTDNKGTISNSTVKIKGDGRCLRLAYDPALRHYSYRGSDCSSRFQYICEIVDKTTSTKLNRLAREMNIDLPEF